LHFVHVSAAHVKQLRLMSSNQEKFHLSFLSLVTVYNGTHCSKHFYVFVNCFPLSQAHQAMFNWIYTVTSCRTCTH